MARRRPVIQQTGPVTERLRVREIDDDEGRRLVRIIRRGSGSVVTWRRAQMVLLFRRYIIWRNNHAYDQRLRRIIDRANVA